jgi:uncharacterized phage protein gp47/JayE
MPFVVKSQAEIINEILVEIVTNIDDVTDLNVGSVLRKLVEALGIEVSDLYDSLQEIYDGTRIDTATGTDLENLGALLGITRKAGTVSQGYVTFQRATPIASDFTIPQSAIVSTQPNTGVEQLRFVVNANTTFLAAITGEGHTFQDGTYLYGMDERFIDSISQVTGLVATAPYTFLQGTDYQLTKDYIGLILDPDSITDVDDCDATTGWVASADATALAVDGVDFKQGTGSLDMGKSGVASDTITYDKILGAIVDSSNKDLYLWIKIEDAATLNKLQNIRVMLGSAGSGANSYELSFIQTELEVGWKRYKIDFGDARIIRSGVPNEAAMNYIRITAQTNVAGDTIASGDLKMDWWLVGNSVNYEGDIVEWLQTGTLPDDGTTYSIDYIPLSKEVLCDSEEVGTKYNVGRHKVIYKVSYITNIDSIDNYVVLSGGTDEEEDDDLRERIINATELKGKATSEALRQAVLAVEGVTSVSINDMPLRTQSAEVHGFIDIGTTPTQKLDYEVALIDVTLDVSGTAGAAPYTFISTTDFYLQDTTIVWVPTATVPDNGTNFFTDYNYRWLGHVEMFVTGTSTPLPGTVSTNIDTAIADTKAAGVVVTWTEPTPIAVNVTSAILVDTANGYTFADVSTNVETALTTFLNDKEAGDDVYLAGLIDVIMDVTGVLNTTISVPGADVTIAADEVARPGTIIVNLIP